MKQTKHRPKKRQSPARREPVRRSRRLYIGAPLPSIGLFAHTKGRLDARNENLTVDENNCLHTEYAAKRCFNLRRFFLYCDGLLSEQADAVYAEFCTQSEAYLSCLARSKTDSPADSVQDMLTARHIVKQLREQYAALDALKSDLQNALNRRYELLKKQIISHLFGVNWYFCLENIPENAAAELGGGRFEEWSAEEKLREINDFLTQSIEITPV